MTSEVHVIRQQYLHVELHGTEADGLSLQGKLPGLCRNWLTPAIERSLDSCMPAQGHLFIERLEIDAGILSLGNLEHDLADAVARAIEKQLGNQLPSAETSTQNFSAAIQHKTEQQSIHEAFIHFLRTGALPWWFYLPADKSIEQVILESWRKAEQTVVELRKEPGYFRAMILDALLSATAITRLVQQFNPTFLEALFARLSPDGSKIVVEVAQTLKGSGLSGADEKITSRQLWQTAFTRLAEGKVQTALALASAIWHAMQEKNLQVPALTLLLKRLSLEMNGGSASANVSESALQDVSPSEKLMRNSEPNAAKVRPKSLDADRTIRDTPSKIARTLNSIDLKEGIYINCAGLVLLHPFLPRFFEALGIAAGDKLLQPERALCLLHFLATGQCTAPEYELLLPKLLCNAPFEHPVEADVDLTAAELDEASALLDAVIRHWNVLGNTSADGLRGTFLVRPGKLSPKGDGDWLLQVENQSFDILLDQLPWGIGMIKLPWMEKMLWVEWR